VSAAGKDRGGAEQARAVRRLSLRLIAARIVLLLESLMPALWPGLAVAGVFLVFALSDVFTLFSPFWHVVSLAVFAGAGGFALWRGFGGLVFPDRAQARRRIEITSGFQNRPLAALDDHPATNVDDAGARALWRQHQERMAALARRLKIGFPAASMAAFDPRGLRFFIVLALAIALVDAGGDAPERLRGSLVPDWRALGGGAETRLDVWVSPPEHTGLGPVFLTRAGRPQEEVNGPTQEIAVPAGSRIEARLDGGGDRPDLWWGEDETSFQANGPEGFKVALALEPVSGGDQKGAIELRVVQGWWTLGRWSLSLIEDRPPEIEFTQSLSKSERMALRIDYEAGDDYAIVAVTAEISQFTNSMLGREGNIKSSKAAAKGNTLNVALPPPAPGEGRGQSSTYHDLTAHPWAGLPVLVRLRARDGIGQTGYSSSKLTVLPAREFSHPVAVAIIEERRRLSRHGGGQGGALRRHTAYNLGALAKTPDEFGDDMVVFLGLQIARRRLLEDPAPSEFGEVQRLLWDIALRLDDKGLSLAERDFRAAEDALNKALAEGGAGEEIESMINDLEVALENYLAALAEAQGRARESAGRLPADASVQVLRGDDLRAMIDMAREMLRTGSREGAREMLARLRETLENLHSAGAQSSAFSKFTKDVMPALSALMGEQQALLDESFRRARERAASREDGGAENGEDGLGEARSRGEAQTDLRRRLDDFMNRLAGKLGQVPVELGQASRSMGEASRALSRDALGEATDYQAQALEGLRQGARGAMEAYLRQMETNGKGDAKGDGDDLSNPAPGGDLDPLGRPLPGPQGNSQGRVHIPAEMELRKAREVLDELRRRAGEADRPAPEKAYIERLIPDY